MHTAHSISNNAPIHEQIGHGISLNAFFFIQF